MGRLVFFHPHRVNDGGMFSVPRFAVFNVNTVNRIRVLFDDFCDGVDMRDVIKFHGHGDIARAAFEKKIQVRRSFQSEGDEEHRGGYAFIKSRSGGDAHADRREQTGCSRQAVNLPVGDADDGTSG